MSHKSIETEIKVDVKGVDEAVKSLKEGREATDEFIEEFDGIQDAIQSLTDLVSKVQELKDLLNNEFKINLDTENIKQIFSSDNSLDSMLGFLGTQNIQGTVDALSKLQNAITNVTAATALTDTLPKDTVINALIDHTESTAPQVNVNLGFDDFPRFYVEGTDQGYGRFGESFDYEDPFSNFGTTETFGITETFEDPFENIFQDANFSIDNITITTNNVDVDSGNITFDDMDDTDFDFDADNDDMPVTLSTPLDRNHELDVFEEMSAGEAIDYVTNQSQEWLNQNLKGFLDKFSGGEDATKALLLANITGFDPTGSEMDAVREALPDSYRKGMFGYLQKYYAESFVEDGLSKQDAMARAEYIADGLYRPLGTPFRQYTNQEGDRSIPEPERDPNVRNINHDATRFENFGREYDEYDDDEMERWARLRGTAIKQVKDGRFDINRYIKSERDMSGILDFLNNYDRIEEQAMEMRSRLNSEIRDNEGNIIQEGSTEWHTIQNFLNSMARARENYSNIRAQITADGTPDGIIDNTRLEEFRIRNHRQAVARERMSNYDIDINERAYSSTQDLYSAYSRRSSNLQQDILAFDEGSEERARLETILSRVNMRMSELEPLIEDAQRLRETLNREALSEMTTMREQRIGQSDDSYLRQLQSQLNDVNTRGRRIARTEDDGESLTSASTELQQRIAETQERIRLSREQELDILTTVPTRGMIQSQRSYASTLESQYQELQRTLRTAREGTDEHTRIRNAMEEVNDELERTQRRIANQDTIRQLSQRSESIFTTMNQAFELGERLWGHVSRGLTFVDSYTTSNARLNYINDDTSPGAMEDLELQRYISDMSSRTRTRYAETADMVSKFQMSEGFDSPLEAAKFTETVMKSFRIAGSSESEASDATRQLTQAFSKGKLDGDEFRSVAENAPIIINAIANLLGTDKGGVMTASRNGELTIDILKQAIASISDEVTTAFEDIPITFSDMKVTLENEIGQFLTTTDAGRDLTSEIFGIVEDFVDYITSEDGVESLTSLAQFAGGIAEFGGELLEVTTPLLSFFAQAPGLLMGVVGGFQALKFVAQNPLDEMLDNVTSVFDLMRSGASSIHNAWNSVNTTLAQHGTSILGIGAGLGALALGLTAASRIVTKIREDNEEDALYEDSRKYGGKNRIDLKAEGYTYDEAMRLEELYLERNRLETGLRHFEARQATGSERIAIYDSIEDVYNYTDIRDVRDARTKALELEQLNEEIASLSYMDKEVLDEIAENTAKTAENTSESGFLKQFKLDQAKASHTQTINQTIAINVSESVPKAREYARELAKELREQAMLGATS